MNPQQQRRILFVDDEQQVLDGLANLLRKQRRVWDMHFACGAEAAYAALAQARYDVVVCDMRMPQTDGATLLRHVKERQPGAARIVLSGHCERAMVTRALAVAHQFVNKPCEGETLRAIIERTASLRAILQSQQIREIVGTIDKIPPVPALFVELSQAIDSHKSSTKDIARIVERDPAMCAKVLQLANSAFFGRARALTSTAQAVAFLGVEVLRGLALSAGVFGSSKMIPHIDGFTLEAEQRHALDTALRARELAASLPTEHDGSEPRDDAFTAGLVHDVGKTIMAVGAPELLRGSLALARADGIAPYEAERLVYGATHAEVGAYLLGMWGLPTSIVEAVAFHHLDDPPCELAKVVQQADRMSRSEAATASRGAA